MEKPVKEAVSVVIRNAQGETLFALRSPHKKSHPLTWSLPSHYVAENETPDGTVARIGLHTLGAKLKLVRFLNEGYGDRPDFKLLMHVYEAEVVAGEPHIASDDYVELKWTKVEDFLPTLRVKGECTRLYSEYLERTKSEARDTHAPLRSLLR